MKIVIFLYCANTYSARTLLLSKKIASYSWNHSHSKTSSSSSLITITTGLNFVIDFHSHYVHSHTIISCQWYDKYFDEYSLIDKSMLAGDTVHFMQVRLLQILICFFVCIMQ